MIDPPSGRANATGTGPRTNGGGDAQAGAGARAAALNILRAVLRRGQSLDEALSANTDLQKLDVRDRNFSRMLVATTLRRLGQIDVLIRRCLDHALPSRATVVQDILRLGACQLVFLHTPPHAAVDQMVTLTGNAGHPRFTKLVNAVLRRLSREGRALLDTQDAARLNTPDWLWSSWSSAYGEDVCRAIATAHLEEAPLDISVKENPAFWAEQLSASQLPNGSLRRQSGGAIRSLTGFNDGAWWVQDAAAALPARLLGNVGGRTVIELCAAPGGKTAQLVNAGARVIAVDRAAGRLQQLEENLSRLRLSAQTVCADAALWRPKGPVNFVLLDAPCTATGTIRRHPDIPHRKTPRDVAQMTVVQEQLLNAAMEMVTPGGLLVYSTCSLQPEEGIARIEATLESTTAFERLPITSAEIGGLDQIFTPAGDIRTLPSHLPAHGGLDGFYIARLRRKN